MGGKPTGAGRTVVLASFLLGGPSGSGVATTVTIGAVAYPMLEGRLREERRRRPARRRRARRDHLAAGARRRGVPDRRVPEDLLPRRDLMATIPTCLYYLSLFLMVEIDARKFGVRDRRHLDRTCRSGS